MGAYVADWGAYDLCDAFLDRLPGPLANPNVARALSGPRRSRPGSSTALLPSPPQGGGLRRGMLIHGASDPLAYLNALREFPRKERASQIRYPTWVSSTERDDITTSAPQLVKR